MTSFLKPPDTPLPSESYRAAGNAFGFRERDYPVLRTLDPLETIKKYLICW